MIGREQEISDLKDLYGSGQAELIAIYGRRRVGKTYLVDEVFSRNLTFRHCGLSPLEQPEKGMMRAQLAAFYQSLRIHGMEEMAFPKDWMEAFTLLVLFLQERDDGSRQIVFLDELPWLDTPRANFLMTFEFFWNGWACHRKNMMVIVCGSANSWILDNLINNHGGLYGRVTYEIKLEPFSLKECEQFLGSNHVHLSRYDIVQAYMAVGGIPYYLKYFQKGFSLAQNLDCLFFSRNAKLKNEYNRLFASVFTNPDEMKQIVQVLHTKNAGYTRSEIAKRSGISSGGRLTEYLDALLESSFITKYVPFGYGMNEEHYKLADPFCIFCLRFVDCAKEKDVRWNDRLSSRDVVSWRGIAFENVCFLHIDQIRRALGISGIRTSQSAWSKREDDQTGTQINLVLKRADNITSSCEIRYAEDVFAVDKAYYQVLQHRQALLEKELSPRMSVHNTLITTFGLRQNEYAGIFSNVITLDDLFV